MDHTYFYFWSPRNISDTQRENSQNIAIVGIPVELFYLLLDPKHLHQSGIIREAPLKKTVKNGNIAPIDRPPP